MGHDVIPHVIWNLFSGFVVEVASFGRDCETGWDVDASGRHLGKTKAFSAKDFLAELLLVGFLEGEYIFFVCHIVLLLTIFRVIKAP